MTASLPKYIPPKQGTNPRPVAKKRNFERVQNILSRALGRHGLDREIARYKFVLHWSEIVGQEIAQRAMPECIRGTTLMVKVCDSVWAQELAFQKEIILKRLKRFLSSGEVVRDIHFFVH